LFQLVIVLEIQGLALLMNPQATLAERANARLNLAYTVRKNPTAKSKCLPGYHLMLLRKGSP